MNNSASQAKPCNRSRAFAPVHPRAKQGYYLAALCLGLFGAPAISRALTFNFVPSAGTSQAAINGFAAAGARWSSLFTDNVTVNVNIDFSALGVGILGSTGSSQGTTSYTNFKNALAADRTSTADFTAVANLQSGSAFSLLMNRTSNSPFWAGSATTFLDNDGDANNTTVRLTFANAKALGLLSANNTASDASISFSNLFSWDFNPTDGITAGAFDFVGVATHEIGHALGFISGVDILDGNSSTTFFADNQFTYVSPLDLFRHSAQSGTAIDWAADARSKYFSIDGGASSIADFSTGLTWGDGRQASHWKDNLGLGIMDPTSAPGELLSISADDALAFDVIGWNRSSTNIPDQTSSLALIIMGAAGLVAFRRRLKTSPES